MNELKLNEWPLNECSVFSHGQILESNEEATEFTCIENKITK